MDGHETRHCAFCLKEISALLVKMCSGCERRAYCSEECQTVDSSVSGSGQRHKNWCCRYEYGEEDIDWEVLPIANKGLGVVAKRLLPAGYRILVEQVYTDPNDHPGIKDLEGGDKHRDGGKPFIGLRTSRVNHSCQPNACPSYDQVARVNILVAQQDIQPGEEICIIYSFFGCFNSPRRDFVHPKDAGLSTDDQHFAHIKRSLMVNWGISCPPDCYCRNPQARKLILEGKKFYKMMVSFATEGRFEDALTAGENLLKIDAQLNTTCWVQRADIYFKLFDMANQLNRSKKEEIRTRQYLQSTYDICMIISPYAKVTRFCSNGLNQLQEPRVDFES